MNGDQMTEAIKSISPGTPVLLVTGFADMPIDNVEPKHRPDLILRKPITQMALRQAVARVLAAIPKADQPNQVPINSS
jgi:FixJ family two-component response regulator